MLSSCDTLRILYEISHILLAIIICWFTQRLGGSSIDVSNQNLESIQRLGIRKIIFDLKTLRHHSNSTECLLWPTFNLHQGHCVPKQSSASYIYFVLWRGPTKSMEVWWRYCCRRCLGGRSCAIILFPYPAWEPAGGSMGSLPAHDLMPCVSQLDCVVSLP